MTFLKYVLALSEQKNICDKTNKVPNVNTNGKRLSNIILYGLILLLIILKMQIMKLKRINKHEN